MSPQPGGSGLGAAARDPGRLRAGISLPLLPRPNKHAAARLALLAVLPGLLFSVLIITLALFLFFFSFNRLVSFLLCTWWFVIVGAAGLVGGCCVEGVVLGVLPAGGGVGIRWEWSRVSLDVVRVARGLSTS